jgi:hypothetical protein
MRNIATGGALGQSESVLVEEGKMGELYERRCRRIVRLLSFVGAAVFIFYLLNTLYSSISLDGNRWVENSMIPVLPPLGIDFRTGIFRPAEMLASGGSPYDTGSWYPPFVALAALPLTLLSENSAYQLQFFLLSIANISCILIALRVARTVSGSRDDAVDKLASRALFVIVALYTVTGYPFMFSLERGNYDIFAMLFSLTFLWLLIEKPKSIWLQVITFLPHIIWGPCFCAAPLQMYCPVNDCERGPFLLSGVFKCNKIC